MNKKDFIKKINWEILLISVILIFAFFIRVYNLGNAPLWVDEATSSMASKMILVKGLPIFDSGLLYSRAYVFHYFQSFFMLFGQTDFFVRFISVIFGLLTIVLVYFIGKEYSKSGGIISALFMAVFYLEIFFSRQARFYQLFQLMFFLSLYLLYKSKKNPNYLYFALVSFLITLDSQIEGLVLAPFFIIWILIYQKKWKKYLAIIPAIPLVWKAITVFGLSSGSVENAVNYVGNYFSYASNVIYLFILSIPGIIWSFKKNKKLTLLIIIPSIITLIGVFSLQTFALRYSYFFVFPLILYFSLLISFLYEKYGKIMIVLIIILLIIPSNLFFPQTFVNVIKPVDYNFNDYSAPATNYKIIPENVLDELRNSENVLISYFSSDIEWYVRKPDFVLPFSMDGRGEDQISMNSSKGLVDRYSGALILKERPEDKYYLIGDSFSVSKLKDKQREFLEELTEGCEEIYDAEDLKIYRC